jgi:hypothetical protein
VVGRCLLGGSQEFLTVTEPAITGRDGDRVEPRGLPLAVKKHGRVAADRAIVRDMNQSRGIGTLDQVFERADGQQVAPEGAGFDRGKHADVGKGSGPNHGGDGACRRLGTRRSGPVRAMIPLMLVGHEVKTLPGGASG